MAPTLVKSRHKPQRDSLSSLRAGTTARPSAIILIGFMGAGKSSVGRALGELLGWTFEDLDDRIERREGRKVYEIFRDSGEPEFRRAEHAALKDLLAELPARTGQVAALGGGAFVQSENARLIQSSGVPTVFLDAEVEELWHRCCKQAEAREVERPLLRDRKNFLELYHSRRPHYLRASLRQETSGLNIEQVAAKIARSLGLDQKPGRRGKKH